MKKTTTLLLLVFLVKMSFSQNKSNSTSIKQTDSVEIITDNLFQNGIRLLGSSSATPAPIDTLYPFGKTDTSPVWKMPQWATRFNLKGIKPQLVNDSIIYQNEGKKVSFFRAGNEVSVGLEVYGSKEYKAPRKANEAWPHLLVEQQTNQIRLYKLNKLLYTIDARLLYDVDKMGSAFDPGLHTSQVTLYLLVQNVNKQSAALGDYFWFGLPLYDHRYQDMKEYAAQDLGKEDATKKFILNVPSKTLFRGSLHDRQWTAINKNIYPLLIDAFKKAQKNGYLKTTAFEDLAIESINLGWEVPGTFDCGIQFKNLRLTGVTGSK